MNKTPVTLAIVGLFNTPFIFAATNLDNGSTNPTIVVSAIRSEQSEVTTPASISIISRDEIDRSGAQNVADVLRARGGIQISDLFGDGSRTNISMRGFSADSAKSNTLILIDGRSMNNIDMSSPRLNNIALKDVERIEIIQGSAGTLFGDQAVGGVINIITRQPTEFSGDVELGLGSYDTKTARGSVSNYLDNGISFRLSAESRKSDNYREHNALDYNNGFGRIDYDYGNGTVFAETQRTLEDLELPGALTQAEMDADRTQVNPLYPDDFNDSVSTLSRVGVMQNIGTHWQLEAELSAKKSNTFGKAWGSDFEQDYDDTGFTPRFIGTIPGSHGETLITIGADLYDYKYVTDWGFGEDKNTQENRAYYAQAVVPLSNKITGTFGARHASMESEISIGNLDDSVTVGEIGLSYQASPRWRLFARGDSNFRFPKVDEQTYTEPGVDGLDTQTGISYEVGSEWKKENASFKAVVYRLTLDNEIDYDSTADGPWGPGTGANVNLDSTQRTGLILEGSLQAITDLLLTAQYTYVDPEIDGGSFSGNSIPFVARNVLRMSADYRLNSHWNLFGELQYTGERYQGSDYENLLDKLPALTIVNMNINYRNGPYVLSAKVNNLTNEKYSNYATYDTYYPAPERNFLFNASFAF